MAKYSPAAAKSLTKTNSRCSRHASKTLKATGDTSHSTNAGDWVKVTMPAGTTKLRVQTVGNASTDTLVAVTTNGTTAAGMTTDSTDTGSFVDATFTGLTAGSTYYVEFKPGTVSGGGGPTDYVGVIRAY